VRSRFSDLGLEIFPRERQTPEALGALQRIALPISIGSVRYPGIKIHETRIIRLMEVLLHGGTQVAGWTAKQIHEAVADYLRPLGEGLSPEPAAL
jgi:hypothetical protein